MSAHGIKTKRAFGYVRQSKEKEGSKSPKAQAADIRRLCELRGWELVETFYDVGESAFQGRSRPSLEAMRKRLSDADVIVFWKLDRLARSLKELLAIAEECQDKGVELAAVDGAIDTTTAQGKLFYQIRGSIAEFEVNTTQERIAATFTEKRANDEPIGPPPYGWRRENKHHVPDSKQQAVLREAARRYIKGDTLSAIAAALSDRYVTSLPTGGGGRPRMFRPGNEPRLHVAPISRMLTTLALPPAEVWERRRREFGEALADELADALRDRKQTRSPNSNPSLLGGIARCGVCGGSMRRSSTRADRPGRWYQYRCPKPGHVGIAAPWLEEYVSSAALGAIDLRKLARTAKQRQRQPAAVELVALEARIEELEDMLGDGTLTKAAFVRQRDRLRTKTERARQVVADEATAELPLQLVRGLPGSWSELDTTERRDVIRAVLREVVVNKAATNTGPKPDRVHLVLR